VTKRGARIRHPKRRGEWAEMCFMMRAAELGLEVSKPWGDTARYDFIVERARYTARVQVKSTMCRYHTGYACQVRDCHGGAYMGDPFDFVAAYLILEDIWYIIPAKMVRGKSSVGLYPRLKWSIYEPFREAWHLLPGKSAKSGTVGAIEACAEEEMSFPFSLPGSQEMRPQILLAGG
jgi:PD-(D/E)XK endonuclease